jgi:nicotinamidase-related amidase
VPLELTEILAGRALGDAATDDGATGDSADPTTLPVAALTMELQRGVMGDRATFPELAAAAEAGGIVAQAARLLTAVRQARRPVVHCTAEFRADRAGTLANTPLHTAVLRRPEHMLERTPATQLVPALGVETTDYVSARRHGVAPFTGTPLHATLQGLGVRVLVVAGVSVNLGVLGLCIEAVGLGYQVVVASDAVAGVPPDFADQVLANSIALVAAVHTVDEIVTALDVLTR